MHARHILPVFAGLVLAIFARGESLVLKDTIPLPDVGGRIDHFGFDAARNRLFVAALGNNTVEVIDLAARRRLQSLKGFAEPQGIVFAPELNRIFVANGDDGTVRVLDGNSFRELARIDVGDDADNVRYEAEFHRIYVGYGAGGIALIDAPANRVEARIPLSGHPESFQLDPGSPRLFVNVPRARQVVVLDRKERREVVARSLLLAGGNFPLAFDAPAHRLYVGCRSPTLLLTLDSDNSYEVAHADLHRDCDDVFLDAKRHRLFASCGEGFLDVFSVATGADPQRLESVATEPGARTSYFDGDNIYLAVPKRGSHPAEIRIYGIK